MGLVVADASVRSVVSFDRGGEWLPLQKPANSKCDAAAKDPDKVNRRVCLKKVLKRTETWSDFVVFSVE